MSLKYRDDISESLRAMKEMKHGGFPLSWEQQNIIIDQLLELHRLTAKEDEE